MLSVRLLVNSRLFWGSQNLCEDFSTVQGLAPLTPKLSKGQLSLAQQRNEISTASLVFKVRNLEEKGGKTRQISERC